jgi:hypothetical protein
MLKNTRGAEGLGAFISEGRGDYSPLIGTACGAEEAVKELCPPQGTWPVGQGDCTPPATASIKEEKTQTR